MKEISKNDIIARCEILKEKVEMVTEQEVERINQLAKKAKTEEGLTETEKEEQNILRRKYVDSYKQNLKSHLDMIKKK